MLVCYRYTISETAQKNGGNLCKKVYKYETSLTRHVQWKHYGVEFKVHSCDMCKKKFPFRNELSRHVTSVMLEFCLNISCYKLHVVFSPTNISI